MISSTKFYKNHDMEFGFDLLCCLIYGLLCGLTYGLLFGGLICGLLWSLLWSLICGFLWGGLVYGLVCYLVCGLTVIIVNWDKALPFFTSFPEWFFLVLGILIISEIMFFLTPKEKLKKTTNIFWHTCKRKFENIVEVSLGFSVVAQVYILIREIKVLNYLPEIIKWIGYIGAGAIIVSVIVFVFYIWIKLNSLKYEEKLK